MGQINTQYFPPSPLQKKQDELKIETVQVQRSACVQVQADTRFHSLEREKSARHANSS